MRQLSRGGGDHLGDDPLGLGSVVVDVEVELDGVPTLCLGSGRRLCSPDLKIQFRFFERCRCRRWLGLLIRWEGASEP
ncbi:hypothetical protein ACFX2J_039761 [Malus domestica]